ncbi:MAG: 30S ribosomal protein S12 methylthiotransferase RimO [Verrucomicrobia bacterium]|nr:30S ribosomal protein S12 methylthiotransferase RimO [Verrucomicrobiota bacterium]
MIALGCAKNLVDAEIMLGSLARAGMEITNDAALADVLIVNTCSFVESAQQESVDTILETAALRQARNLGQGLIVAGCLPQRFRDELPKLLPEVDAFMGIDQVADTSRIVREALARRAAKLHAEGHGPKSRVQSPKSKGQPPASEPPIPHSALRDPHSAAPLVEVDRRPAYIPDYATPRFRLTPRHFAYVKIAEGCNHPCSFCIIPRMRGSHRSRAQADVVAEAQRLLAEGVKELNLISQDTTYYGLDLRPDHTRAIASPERFSAAALGLPAGATTLCTLLRELNALRGEFWIRLLYTHPAHWTDDLIRTIAACPKVARYADIPLQHIHPAMLERMRRETSRDYIVDLLARIRAGIPGITLRTTFIVGFPGETEEYFQTLLEFIGDTRFERLGVFAYSHEAGTRSAAMANQVPERTKRRRRDLVMAAQRSVARTVAAACVGHTLRVLVERPAAAAELRNACVQSWEHGLVRASADHPGRLRGRFVQARSQADAPEIDGRLYVHGELPPGGFASVRVVGHTDYDLLAEPA